MCWDSDGKAIVLKKPEAIADRILTEEFSGMKFSSFIRQVTLAFFFISHNSCHYNLAELLRFQACFSKNLCESLFS